MGLAQGVFDQRVIWAGAGLRRQGQAEILDMLLVAKNDFELGYEIELFLKNEIEIVVVLRKTP